MNYKDLGSRTQGIKELFYYLNDIIQDNFIEIIKKSCLIILSNFPPKKEIAIDYFTKTLKDTESKEPENIDLISFISTIIENLKDPDNKLFNPLDKNPQGFLKIILYKLQPIQKPSEHLKFNMPFPVKSSLKDFFNKKYKQLKSFCRKYDEKQVKFLLDQIRSLKNLLFNEKLIVEEYDKFCCYVSEFLRDVYNKNLNEFSNFDFENNDIIEEIRNNLKDILKIAKKFDDCKKIHFKNLATSMETDLIIMRITLKAKELLNACSVYDFEDVKFQRLSKNLRILLQDFDLDQKLRSELNELSVQKYKKTMMLPCNTNVERPIRSVIHENVKKQEYRNLFDGVPFFEQIYQKNTTDIIKTIDDISNLDEINFNLKKENISDYEFVLKSIKDKWNALEEFNQDNLEIDKNELLKKQLKLIKTIEDFFKGNLNQISIFSDEGLSQIQISNYKEIWEKFENFQRKMLLMKGLLSLSTKECSKIYYFIINDLQKFVKGYVENLMRLLRSSKEKLDLDLIIFMEEKLDENKWQYKFNSEILNMHTILSDYIISLIARINSYQIDINDNEAMELYFENFCNIINLTKKLIKIFPETVENSIEMTKNNETMIVKLLNEIEEFTQQLEDIIKVGNLEILHINKIEVYLSFLKKIEKISYFSKNVPKKRDNIYNDLKTFIVDYEKLSKKNMDSTIESLKKHNDDQDKNINKLWSYSIILKLKKDEMPNFREFFKLNIEQDFQLILKDLCRSLNDEIDQEENSDKCINLLNRLTKFDEFFPDEKKGFEELLKHCKMEEWEKNICLILKNNNFEEVNRILSELVFNDKISFIRTGNPIHIKQKVFDYFSELIEEISGNFKYEPFSDKFSNNLERIRRLEVIMMIIQKGYKTLNITKGFLDFFISLSSKIKDVAVLVQSKFMIFCEEMNYLIKKPDLLLWEKHQTNLREMLDIMKALKIPDIFENQIPWDDFINANEKIKINGLEDLIKASKELEINDFPNEISNLFVEHLKKIYIANPELAIIYQ